ncbi:leukocyte-associated immunoglobulin-like receptor 1 isoform X1 [Trichechus manatus latirostris]|uniref:Leukocyte-associated immunoglobulin-like receptor 1 isoform X1 n=1 Tax=Trichechus manatus latirostris TaxID=127582 RepID=A0A2Y9RJK0_TRIMA|nr:leukocyte-associated immunoglobulin-like receptor 1 isoform X1 [Trichechus manatus latirostris]
MLFPLSAAGLSILRRLQDRTGFGGCGMSPTPTALLGLVLCLGPAIQAQNGHLPKPSISVKPGCVIPWGTSVTFVCQSPRKAESFRLENVGTNQYLDVKSSPGTETEARFPIDSVKIDTAGHYSCLYSTGNHFSERSEILELVVTGFPGSFSSSPTTPHSSLVEYQRPQPGDTTGSQILPPELRYILIGISAVFLLCLLLLALFFLHHQRQRKHGIPRSKGEEQNPQERFGPGVDVLKSTPDMATVNGLPENDRKMDTSAPTAGNPQEVTYAQLDHWALTQGAAPAVSPQFTEPMAKSSMYASLTKR